MSLLTNRGDGCQQREQGGTNCSGADSLDIAADLLPVLRHIKINVDTTRNSAFTGEAIRPADCPGMVIEAAPPASRSAPPIFVPQVHRQTSARGCAGRIF
ncbi:hypothetical protein Nepgr_016706 [Nepenthes gracilis]|uniref:Uncharacterized protein n=1 Tax=Nepenthes gracilis TaxID=150966 RepID=A0AAD3XSQ7_NEPGR|nr:hypothetical protein Nepgr_016706 [Nepenthes gracilis]